MVGIAVFSIKNVLITRKITYMEWRDGNSFFILVLISICNSIFDINCKAVQQ